MDNDQKHNIWIRYRPIYIFYVNDKVLNCQQTWDLKDDWESSVNFDHILSAPYSDNICRGCASGRKHMDNTDC
jgi:hypothetical protein